MRLRGNGSGDSTCRGSLWIVISWLFFLALATAATAANPAVCPAAGSTAGNLIFILDASGSMGAQVQGKIKMDAAKEVMADLIRDLPVGINVGLVVYGHREKSDCNDVEELTPLGPLDKDDLTQQIMAISPKGKTPITISIRTVAEGLNTLEDEATIVLVSDGEETCEGDPCALVKELNASGTKFVMHVIGFDVGEKEKVQLACIAAAGGGSYLSAKNAVELGAAAKKAIEKTELSAGKLKITALRNGKPFRAYYEIFRPVQDEENDREQVADGWTDPEGASFSLVPGVYDIMVINEEDSGSQPVVINGVTVEAGKSIEKVADFTGGTLKIRALRNGKPFRAYCSVHKAAAANEEEEKEQVADGWTDPEGTAFKVAPGTYDVAAENADTGEKKEVKGIAVEANKIQVVEVQL